MHTSEENGVKNGSLSSSVIGSNCLVKLQSCEKAMCTAQCRMLLFCAKKYTSHACFELAQTTTLFRTTGHASHYETLEDERYIVITA